MCRVEDLRGAGARTTAVELGEGGPSLAVGETVILLHCPSSPLLKHLLKGEGDAAE